VRKLDSGQQVGLFSLSYMVHEVVLWFNFSSLLFSFLSSLALFCLSNDMWSLCGWQAVVGECREAFAFG
jgi:NADH:ubiquinone oxidoreductase subunit 5 (subunit L)/multisubunit Na+/H+ antiporter MnhA subunit